MITTTVTDALLPGPSDDELRMQINALAESAGARCGCSHDVYVQIFSSSLDQAFADATAELRVRATAIGTEFDYLTADQVQAAIAQLNEEGYCRHGLDRKTCPAGCFE